MNNARVSIWGRAFDLRVSYDHFDDEAIPQDMVEALDRLLASWQVVDNTLSELKKYCVEHNPDEIMSLYGNCEVDNIFRIAVPESLHVLPSDRKRSVALMLNYRFDPEEGLALLFVNENLASIGPQSGVF